MAETMVAPSVKSDHNTRKNKKPLMEKRRRARINSCLAQLKSLVLQAIKKDSSQFSKLEKADILELTVKHLRTLQRQQAAGVMSQDSTVVSKYRAGFNECANEVVRYMGSVREVNEEVKERVVGHLASCLQVVNQITPMESLQAQHHHQQQMKPLHVHIPPQPINGSVTTVGVVGAPSVIMHTAAVSQPSLTPAGLGGAGYTHAPSPLRPSSSTTSSPQNCHQTPSSSPAVSANALTLQSGAAAAMTTAPTTTAVSPTPPSISGAFKLVPSGAGTVAVYVGTSESVPRAPDTVSVDAVPLYSVSLPAHPHHHHHHPGNTLAAAFVTPPTSSSHLTSVAPPPPDCRYEDVSPVKAEYSPLNAGSSLPVDLRQPPRSKLSLEECMPPYSSALSTIGGGHCSPALADDKLWRPW